MSSLFMTYFSIYLLLDLERSRQNKADEEFSSCQYDDHLDNLKQNEISEAWC